MIKVWAGEKGEAERTRRGTSWNFLCRQSGNYSIRYADLDRSLTQIHTNISRKVPTAQLGRGTASSNFTTAGLPLDIDPAGPVLLWEVHAVSYSWHGYIRLAHCEEIATSAFYVTRAWEPLLF